jgi:hypothetical protein
MKIALLIAASALALAGCAERDQDASGVATDTQAFQGTGMPYTAAGWKPGDRDSWERQLKVRTVQQNEYAKVP